MLVLLSAPRGRISAARMVAAHRDEREEEAYGIIIRPPRLGVLAAEVAPAPRLAVGGAS